MLKRFGSLGFRWPIYSKRSYIPPDSGGPQTSISPAYDQNRDTVASVLDRYRQDQSARAQQQNTKDNKTYQLELAGIIGVLMSDVFTALVVVISACGTYFAYQSSIAASAGAAAARDAAIEAKNQTAQSVRAANASEAQVTIAQASSRPYIFIQIDKEQVIPGSMATKPSGTGAGGYVANYKIVDFGNTPAIIKEIDSEITIDFHRTDQYDSEHHLTDMIIAQGQPGIQRSVGLPTSGNDPTSLVMGGAKLYISLRVAYADTTGRNLYTHICYRQPFANRIDNDIALKAASGPNCDNDRN